MTPTVSARRPHALALFGAALLFALSACGSTTSGGNGGQQLTATDYQFNVTGFSDMHADLSGKYVQFASQLDKPQATINYLWYTEWADGQHRFQATELAAQSLGVKLRSRGIAEIAEIGDAIAEMKQNRISTLIVQPSPFTYQQRGQIIDSATKRRASPRGQKSEVICVILQHRGAECNRHRSPAAREGVE